MAKTALVEKPLAKVFKCYLPWRRQSHSDAPLTAVRQVIVVDRFNFLLTLVRLCEELALGDCFAQRDADPLADEIAEVATSLATADYAKG